MKNTDYAAFFATFFGLAQNAFILSRAASRCAGEKVRFFRAVFAADAVSACFAADPGGRPRLFPPPPRASMARFNLSLSAISNETI